MSKFMKIFSICILSFCIAACVPIQEGEVDISGSGDDPAAREEAGKLSLSPSSDPQKISSNRIECDKLAGSYSRQGLVGSYMCVLRYSDAGKICSKATDCIGQCRVNYFGSKDAKGSCQGNTVPFGCYATLDENGKSSPPICID